MADALPWVPVMASMVKFHVHGACARDGAVVVAAAAPDAATATRLVRLTIAAPSRRARPPLCRMGHDTHAAQANALIRIRRCPRSGCSILARRVIRRTER